MTLGEWLAAAEARLLGCGVESARLEAQVLAAHALGKDRAWVLSHRADPVSVEELDRLLDRRSAREPLAYILGVREFYGRPFAVGPAVLIPRQETEHLVEVGLELLGGRVLPRILDVGTGSGCVAVALQLERPDATVTAVDVSCEALRVAASNAEALGASVEFVLSDAFAELSGRCFDLVVSNPPYVASSDDLPPEVVDHEPHVALYAGDDALGFYRRLARESPPFLASAGALAVEIGIGQAADVERTFEEQGWTTLLRRNDLAGIVRVLAFERRTPRAG